MAQHGLTAEDLFGEALEAGRSLEDFPVGAAP